MPERVGKGRMTTFARESRPVVVTRDASLRRFTADRDTAAIAMSQAIEIVEKRWILADLRWRRERAEFSPIYSRRVATPI